MSYKKNKLLLFVTLMLTQFFFASIFLSNDYLLLESRMLYYRQTTINENYDSNFIHTTFKNDDFSISPQLSSFVRANITRSKKSVIYHELFNNEHTLPMIKTQTGEDYFLNSKILYSPFRFDLNNKYFESFRLRQEFQDVDSRIFSSQYDFTIQIESALAYHFLKINGIVADLNYYKNNHFEVELVFGEKSFIGFVSNIFYIEDSEPISLALQKYHDTYSLIVPSQQMKKTLNEKTHFDYVNTSLRIISEMKKISTLEGYAISFQDDHGESQFLADTMDIIKHNSEIDYCKLVGFSFLFLIYLGLSIYIAFTLFRKESLSLYELLFIIFMSAFIFSALVFFGKKVFSSLFFYNLGNIYSGVLSTIIFATFFIVTFIKYLARKTQ